MRSNGKMRGRTLEQQVDDVVERGQGGDTLVDEAQRGALVVGQRGDAGGLAVEVEEARLAVARPGRPGRRSSGVVALV